ncbi:hypothetical protein ACGFZ3_10625 [Stenotrophomonas sp. NPDC047960]
MAREPRLLAFLQQGMHEPVTLDAALEALDALAR